ncbi:MAG: oligosaccharide flippase family protein [Leptolyngbya sp. SIO3F4]|nr:oligosaccharide flippase family protein [Leptolyngbya sp. SIO3F4]
MLIFKKAINLMRVRRDFIANAATLLSGSAIAQMILLLISPILTRLYTPNEFGEYALFTSIVMLASALVTGQYEVAIMLAHDDNEALNIFTIPIILSTSICSFALVGLFLIERIGLYSIKGSCFFHFLLYLSILFNTLHRALYYWHLRSKDYKKISKNKILMSTVNIIFSISVVWINDALPGLIIGFLTSRLIASIQLLISFLSSIKYNLKCLQVGELYCLMKKYKDFPKYTAPQSLMDNFRLNAINFMISFFYGLDSLGLYSLAQRIIQVPLSFLAASISEVFYQRISSLMNDLEIKATLKLGQKIALSCFFGIVCPLIFISLLFPIFFGIIFGEQWQEAGYLALIITPWLAFGFLSSCISTMPIVFERQRSFFFIALIYNLLIPGTMFTFIRMNQGFLNVFIISSVFGSIYLLFIILWLLRIPKKVMNENGI